MTRDVEAESTTRSEAAASEVTGKFATPPASAEIRGDIVVNVGFLPNGLVKSITYQPAHMSAQDWFDHLCRIAPEHYRPLSGGRGSFAIPGDMFAAATVSATAAV